MNDPSVDRRDAASPRERFPVVDALEALDAWRRDPNPDRRRWLTDVLTAVVTAAGADGAYLEVDAAPLPEFSIGTGILTERPAEASVTDRGEGPAIGRFELRAALGDRRLGTLWLAAGDPDGSVAVRVLELAIDAAWSRAEVIETTNRLEALDVATRAIAAILDIDRALQLIVDTVRDLVGAEYAALGIVDEYGSIERFITTGMSDEVRTRIGPPPHGRGLLGLIIREDRSYRIPDIGSHPDSSGFPPNHPPMASFLGVPVHVKGVSVGNLYLTNKRGASSFGEEDQRLVEMFAVHAGIAIENARLHERVQRLAIVEERERIGKDLHDGIIQSLYAVGLSLEDVPELMNDEKAEAVARVDRAIDSINLAIRDIRNFIFGLRPESLDSADLVAGLATLSVEFRVNTMIDLEVDLPQERLDLPADARLQLLQLAREALSNVSRHSGATRSRLGLTLDPGGATLTITDNGRGFDPGDARADGHLGLRNMEARAYAVGGTFEIDSGPNLGTRIIVRVPDAAAAVAGGPRSSSEN